VSLDSSGGAIQATGSRHPLITEKKIYVGTDYADGSYGLNVYARNDGGLLESIAFDGQIFGTPVLADKKLLVVSRRSLQALDFSTHEQIWRKEFSGLSLPVVIGQTVIAVIVDRENQFVSTELGIAGMNISTGEVIWANEMPLLKGSLPASDGRLVITEQHAATENDLLAFQRTPTFPRALNAADGSVVWEHNFNIGRARVLPLAVPGHLFYTTYASTSYSGGPSLVAIDPATGKINWFASDSNAKAISRLAGPVLVLVHDGQVYRTEEFPTISK